MFYWGELNIQKRSSNSTVCTTKITKYKSRWLCVNQALDGHLIWALLYLELASDFTNEFNYLQSCPDDDAETGMQEKELINITYVVFQGCTGDEREMAKLIAKKYNR